MTIREFEVDSHSTPGPIEQVIRDVEQALHITDEEHSHAAPMGFFCVIVLLGAFALIYRLAFG
jgi:hypothetical protein